MNQEEIEALFDKVDNDDASATTVIASESDQEEDLPPTELESKNPGDVDAELELAADSDNSSINDSSQLSPVFISTKLDAVQARPKPIEEKPEAVESDAMVDDSISAASDESIDDDLPLDPDPGIEAVETQINESAETPPAKEEEAKPVSAAEELSGANSVSDEPVETQSTLVQPAGTPKWVKIALVANGLLTALVFCVALVMHSKSNALLELSNNQSDILAMQCAYNRSAVDWLRGQPRSGEYPLWNEIYQQIELDNEILLQVPTRCGVVNIQRSRPQSLNDRADLKLTIINPNMVTMCRGRLVVRSSPNPRNRSRDYDYEGFSAWQKTLQRQSFDIPDLAPGQSCDVELSVKQNDERDPQYVDFQVDFDYFKAES